MEERPTASVLMSGLSFIAQTRATAFNPAFLAKVTISFKSTFCFFLASFLEKFIDVAGIPL